jgi:hypothetical protein
MNERLIENLATIIAIAGLGLAIVLGPVGRAIARRIAGRRDGPETAELEEALNQTLLRLHEVEERLEFAERLLTDLPVPRQLTE